MLKRLSLIITLLIPALTLSAQEDVDCGLVDAVTLIEACDDCKGALAIIDSLRLKHPDNDALNYYGGVCEYTLRMPEKALESFLKASQLDTTNTWYKEALATAYLAAGKGDKAGEIYLDLSRSNPRKYKNAYTLTLIADSYRLQRDFPNFFDTLEEFARDETVTPDAKYKYLLSSISRFDNRTFQTIMPRIMQLADVFTGTHPYSYDAHNFSMQVNAFAGNDAKVIEEAETICLLAQDNGTKSEMMGLIGDTWYNLGRKRKAYSYYEQALKLNPENCSVLNNYAWYLCCEGRKLAKAAGMSRTSVEKQPDNATFLDTYGWILHLQGRDKEAKPYFKHAMLYGGKESATVLRHYAEVLEALGDKDLASYYYGLADSKESQE